MADRRFTDLELERQLAGDLPADRAFDAQATDADRARLAELRAEHEAFLRSVDVDNEVKRIQQRVARAAPEKRVWWRWLVPASTLAAAAAVLLVLWRRDSPHQPDDNDIQVKGDEITLVVHMQTESGSRRLTTGDDVTAGDRLRFEVNAAKPGFIALVGVDGSGLVSIYFPLGGVEPVPFDPKEHLLPGAIQLDATPGDEKFYAFYAPTPFALDAVKRAVTQNGSLPPGVMKAEVVLKKKVAP